jgi:hypothetical protein
MRRDTVRRILSLLVTVLLPSSPFISVAAAQERDADPLATGVRQVTEGDLKAGIASLQAAIAVLEPQRATKAKEIAQAYLYVGIAHLGFDNEESARGSFRQALAVHPDVRLPKEHASPRNARVFDVELTARKAESQNKVEKFALAPGLAGAGVGVAVGYVLASATMSKTTIAPRANRSPTASIAVTPSGDAIPGVTVLA